MVRDGMESLSHQLKKRKEKKCTECDFQLKLAATATADRNPPARTVSAARRPVRSCDLVWAYQESRIPLVFLCYGGTGTSLG